MKDPLNKDIIAIVRDTIVAVGMELDVRSLKTGVNMMYDFIEHSVLVDTERLYKARNEMNGPVALDEYVRALTLHELGHALDRKALLASLPGTQEVIRLKKEHSRQELYGSMQLLKKLIDENDQDYQFEVTAWNNAERLNGMFHVVSNECLSHMKTHGLATYQQAFSQDRILYEGLAAAEMAIE